ncbi:MAG: (2Fe-2S)-binding protein [Bacteriovoracaceae bacterium]
MKHEVEIDSEFLNQIDQANELISSNEKLDDEVLICECFCVNALDIRNACSHLNKVDLELLQSNLSVGLGCQGCLKRIDYWIDKIF